MSVTLMDVFNRIQAIAPQISRDPLSGARHAPESWATTTQCFANAERKAIEAGGTMLPGWFFHFRDVATLPGRSYIIAVHHAVWLAPDKKLIDVTPFHSDPKHRPLVVNGDAVLFLVDQDAVPLKSATAGLALPSWFFPMTDDRDLAVHVARTEADELDSWEKQVAESEFKTSSRAVDLLRSRRARLRC